MFSSKISCLKVLEDLSLFYFYFLSGFEESDEDDETKRAASKSIAFVFISNLPYFLELFFFDSLLQFNPL